MVLAVRGCVLRRLSVVIMVSEAREMARGALAEALPRRWEHVQGVAGKAERVAASLALTREVLVAAAWVHDIGYAPELLATGFHPLDGARYLAGLGVPERVVNLVARMGHDSERAALIYQHQARGADRIITDSIRRSCRSRAWQRGR
jgi:HD superfamily phosphodiesterase